MNTRNRSTARTTALVRPRFSLLQVLVIAILLMVAVTVGNRVLNRHPVPQPLPQTVNIITLDPSLVDTGPNAWIINPLRAACAEWNNDDGRYAWIINPLAERGFTPDDILNFCDRLAAQP